MMMLNVAVILFLMIPFLSQAAIEKASLENFCSKFKQGEQISALFKESTNLEKSPEKALKPLLKKNQKVQAKLISFFDESASFARGEIENEKTLNCVLQSLQLSMLKVRADSFKKDWAGVQKIFQSWFLFAADFPYEESSLVGLRFTGVMRALLLDELERIQKKFSGEIAANPKIRTWFLALRAPWPVDRVMVTEAKRLLKPPMMPVAQAAAKNYQKNPYETSEQALKKIKGGDASEAELLKQIWRESDIQMMKTEMNRIGSLKLRLAQAEFQLSQRKAATSVNELVQQKLLDAVPMDYFTGQPLGLTMP